MRALHRLAPEMRVTRLLDIGGGRSGLAALLYPDAQITTLDVDPAHAQAWPNRWPGVDFVCGDAARLPFAEGAFDAVTMFDLLEHVPEDGRVAAEAMRVLRPGGAMFHSVNCGDHYAYVDRRINQLNYLRYSDREWVFWDNAFLYQNRMRAHEFVDRARDAGFEIVLDTARPTERRLAELAAMRVHAQFAQVPPEKLCITSVDFIGRKPGEVAAP
jgi:SAM-dependent methyltransferase